MNKFFGIGRITTKPELKYSQTNIPFTKFNLAVERTYSNANGVKETDFINILVWRKQAENVCTYLEKGSRVAIEGRIQTGSYDDKDGNKRYTFEVVADNVQFLESKKSGQAVEKSPYDFQEKEEKEEDPFKEFGESITIDDNFLD